MERRQGPMADSISRLLSVIALVAAAGSTYFLHQENQALKKELAAIEGLPAVLEETKRFNRDWNKQLTEVVEQFQQRSGEIINKNEEDLQTRQRNLQTDLAELQSIPIEFSVLEKRLAMLQDIVSTPRLSVMETRLRPIDGQVIPRTVRNDGFAEAEVTSVSFMPTRGAQFRLSEPVQRDYLVGFEPETIADIESAQGQLAFRTGGHP